jgi:hypothetical protein
MDEIVHVAPQSLEVIQRGLSEGREELWVLWKHGLPEVFQRVEQAFHLLHHDAQLLEILNHGTLAPTRTEVSTPCRIK